MMKELLPAIAWLTAVQGFTNSGMLGLCQRSLIARSATLEGDATFSGSSDIMEPDMNAFSSAYTTVFDELKCKERSSDVIGKIPDDLVGTYFRSSPGMFSAGSILPPKKSLIQPKQPPVPDGANPDRMVIHPYEGDGAMLGVTFNTEGEVVARLRYVRSVPFTYERKKGQRVYKGMDSTREQGSMAGSGLGNDLPVPLYRHNFLPGLNKLRKNSANQQAIYFGKRLFALWEGGQPHKLDPLALSTDGRSMLGGAIKKEPDSFGGRLVVDPRNGHGLFYALSHESRDTGLVLFEFDETFKLIERVETKLPGFAMVNDFAVTKDFALFLQPSCKTSMSFVVDKAPKNVQPDFDAPATLTLVPRPGSSKEAKSFDVPVDGIPDANVQFVNAYQQEGGKKIVIDLIRSDPSRKKDCKLNWPWGTTLSEYQAVASLKSLWRYTLDTTSGQIQKEQLIEDRHVLFPTVHPTVKCLEHRYTYVNVGSLPSSKGSSPPQGLGRYDSKSAKFDTWMPNDKSQFCGEPMYAPARGQDGEDSGYILSVLYDGKEKASSMIILRANSIASGPIATIPLGYAVPHSLGGASFSDAPEACGWKFEEIERREKLAEKMESKGNMWNEVRSEFSGLGLRFSELDEYGFDFFF